MTEEGVKVILVGNTAVGKTSLVNCFLDLPFDDGVLSTNMASYQRKNVLSTSGKSVRLDIWDTAGQEKYRAMLPIYFRSATVALLCFDSNSKESIQDWYNTIVQASPACEIFLVLTKNDLYDDKTVNDLMAFMRNKCDELKLKNAFSTSSKNNDGVDMVFKKAADIATAQQQELVPKPLPINKNESNKAQCC